jgi:hypothetical protein
MFFLKESSLNVFHPRVTSLTIGMIHTLESCSLPFLPFIERHSQSTSNNDINEHHFTFDSCLTQIQYASQSHLEDSVKKTK